MGNIVAIDIGYSSTKVIYDNKMYKIPTAVSYAGAQTLDYGDQSNIVKFEGEDYVVGAPTDTSFVTTDYKFLYKFAPLIIYRVLKLIGVDPSKKIYISTGLAISDWSKRNELIDRINSINEINGEKFDIEISHIIPQGAGVYVDYLTNNEPEIKNYEVMIVDIGFNTINTIKFSEGKPDKHNAHAHVGKGVTSIVKDFTNYLEIEFNMPFSEQEALKIFMKKTFTYNGIEQEKVKDKITTLKKQFINQLFNSVLTSEKKFLSTSDRVIIAGGGCYLLSDVPMPPNVRYVSEPYEFSNVRGYYINGGGSRGPINKHQN